MPRGFHVLIAAQFFSALADNALLIVAIALLQQLHLAAWLAPMLKFSFTLAYVLLAPVIGPLSDAMAKARLMAWMNGIKVAGVLLLLAGVHPLAAFALVGLGAAAYAPAKYGWITESVKPSQLVAANGWIEVSVVCAALLGAVAGGLLVSPAWLGLAWLQGAGLQASLAATLALYAVAAALNLGIPDSGLRHARGSLHPGGLARAFAQANRRLWLDREGGLSLAVTTVFWGLGATLQFLVLRWASEVLGLSLSQAAYLQGVVAVGVVGGAALAGAWVPLHAARRMLPFGVLLGLSMPLLAFTHSLVLAIPLLVLVGVVGGLLVVPLNALLQHRGCQLMSAGRSIAVQGFNENASVLAMLSLYAALVGWQVPLQALMTGFGLGIAALMAALAVREFRRDGCGRRAPLPKA